MLVPGLANQCWRRCGGLGVFARPFITVRWPTKEGTVLRTDAASAAMGASKFILVQACKIQG